MLLIVVLAQEDRARVHDHFHVCLRDAASVTRNPEVHAHAGRVVPHLPGGALRPGEVVSEDSHRQSLQRLMSDSSSKDVQHVLHSGQAQLEHADQAARLDADRRLGVVVMPLSVR